MAVLEEPPVGEHALRARLKGGAADHSIVVLPDAQHGEAGRDRKAHGREPVVGASGQVHHGAAGSRAVGGGWDRERRCERVGGADADRVRAHGAELADEPRGPDQVVGEDEDAKGAGLPPTVRRGHSTVQVSPERSTLARSPGPCRAIASRTWASTSSSWVGRGTFRMTPIGTGNSGQ